MKIKAIVTGSTGMVGEGVLNECLQNAKIESVLVLNRKPCGIIHPKLKEIIHANFFDLTAIEDKLHGYNACYFCLGVSSVGMKEDEYTKMTYTLTMNVASTLSRLNNNMVFCYISGAATDSSEKGKQMWARVKGKTENDLMKLPFKKAYAFRPGFMKPEKDAKNVIKYYKFIGWAYPLFRALKLATTIQEVGAAMINATDKGYNKNVIEITDIVALTKM